MAGGRGTRLDSPHEKPLHPICGVPMVDRVCSALQASAVDRVFVAVSPNAPETRAHLAGREGVRSIETAGEGYVTDLIAVLDHAAIEPPVMTVAADLPLLTGAVIDGVLDRYAGHTDAPSMTVCVPVALKRRLGVSVDTRLDAEPQLAPTGVNIVGHEETTMTTCVYDPRVAVNVNRPADVAIANEYRIEAAQYNGSGDPCA